MSNQTSTQGDTDAVRNVHETAAPQWLLAFWREIDDKTWGKGFDCFAPNATATWVSVIGTDRRHSGKSAGFCRQGFTAHHDVVESWTVARSRCFRGFVT